MPNAAVREGLLSLQLPGVRLGAMPAEPVRRLPSGIAPLDAVLGGGLPRGHVSEIVGGPSSGRTALLHAWLAATTRCGEVVAVVDPFDGLDPPSLARAGADLDRVLWVRPPTVRVALKCADLILGAGGFGLVALDLGQQRKAEGRRHADSGTSRLPPSAFHPPSTFHLPPSALPRSAWTRLAQVTRRAGAAVVVFGSRRMTTSCAALALELTQRRARWDGRLFEGFTTSVALTRSRFGAAERAVRLTIGEQPLTDIDGVRAEWVRGEERRASG